MPYPPGLEPLPFHHARADAAADACARAASVLAEATRRRHAFATAAQREWRGAYRQRFDTQLRLIESAAADLEADLLRLAGSIRDASAAARVENLRRSVLRAKYRREHPDEFAPARAGGPR